MANKTVRIPVVMDIESMTETDYGYEMKSILEIYVDILIEGKNYDVIVDRYADVYIRNNNSEAKFTLNRVIALMPIIIYGIYKKRRKSNCQNG